MFWSGRNIWKKCCQFKENEDLEEGIDYKINANSIDIGFSEIKRITQSTMLPIIELNFDINNNMNFDYSKQIRRISLEPQKVKYCTKSLYKLFDGAYELRLNVYVKMPNKCIGLMSPRSTLNRLGIMKFSGAVFDAGYEGYGTQSILIQNVKYVCLNEKFLMFQMMVANAEETNITYSGKYQREGIKNG